MRKNELCMFGHRFSEERGRREVGRARLYLPENDLHDRPYGLLEDVWVDMVHRHEGIGGELVSAVIASAREEGCYKLIATSRNDGTRDAVHKWYTRLGFKEWGTEFRMDF
ncbi:MAG: GNAT family N-acetyltransferase [bacterium]|nr:GNAT family N-acetyltransferase [bacterium]